MAKSKTRGLSDYNKFMKKELKGKKGGTKAQRVARFRAAVKKWKSKRSAKKVARRKSTPVKRSGRTGRYPTRTTRKVSTGGRKRMGFNSQKIYGLVRKAALLAPAAAIAMSGATVEAKIDGIIGAYTGFKMSDRSFNFGRLMTGYGPALGATLATYGLPKLAGIIRGL